MKMRKLVLACLAAAVALVAVVPTPAMADEDCHVVVATRTVTLQHTFFGGATKDYQYRADIVADAFDTGASCDGWVYWGQIRFDGGGLVNQTHNGEPAADRIKIEDLNFQVENPFPYVDQQEVCDQDNDTVDTNLIIEARTGNNLTNNATTDIATADTAGSHGFSVNDAVIVDGADQEGFNRSTTVTNVVDSDTFKYATVNDPATPATGDPIVAVDTAWPSEDGGGCVRGNVNPTGSDGPCAGYKDIQAHPIAYGDSGPFGSGYSGSANNGECSNISKTDFSITANIADQSWANEQMHYGDYVFFWQLYVEWSDDATTWSGTTYENNPLWCVDCTHVAV